MEERMQKILRKNWNFITLLPRFECELNTWSFYDSGYNDPNYDINYHGWNDFI